jgi:hypothetical protein
MSEKIQSPKTRDKKIRQSKIVIREATPEDIEE